MFGFSGLKGLGAPMPENDVGRWLHRKPLVTNPGQVTAQIPASQLVPLGMADYAVREEQAARDREYADSVELEAELQRVSKLRKVSPKLDATLARRKAFRLAAR